jgi:hypothetical protein
MPQPGMPFECRVITKEAVEKEKKKIDALNALPEAKREYLSTDNPFVTNSEGKMDDAKEAKSILFDKISTTEWANATHQSVLAYTPFRYGLMEWHDKPETTYEYLMDVGEKTRQRCEMMYCSTMDYPQPYSKETSHISASEHMSSMLTRHKSIEYHPENPDTEHVPSLEPTVDGIRRRSPSIRASPSASMSPPPRPSWSDFRSSIMPPQRSSSSTNENDLSESKETKRSSPQPRDADDDDGDEDGKRMTTAPPTRHRYDADGDDATVELPTITDSYGASSSDSRGMNRRHFIVGDD